MLDPWLQSSIGKPNSLEICVHWWTDQLQLSKGECTGFGKGAKGSFGVLLVLSQFLVLTIHLVGWFEMHHCGVW